MKLIKSKLIPAALLVLASFNFTQAAINQNDKNQIIALKNYIKNNNYTKLFVHKKSNESFLPQKDITDFINKSLNEQKLSLNWWCSLM